MKFLIAISVFYTFFLILLQVECGKNATKESRSIFEGIDLITPKLVPENNFIDNHLNFNESIYIKFRSIQLSYFI